MDDVWIKFSEDSGVPENMDESTFQKLSAIFDITNNQSEWVIALNSLGMNTEIPLTGIVRFQDHHPMINWSYMSRAVSGGSVILGQDNTGEHQVKLCLTPRTIWRLICIQWQVSKYILTRLKSDAPLPEGDREKIIESLALGLCLLSLTQRLKDANEENMALWLRTPDKLSASVRKTVMQIQFIQQRRTLLSPAWHKLFPPVSDHAEIQTSTMSDRSPIWKGHGVCGAEVSGSALVFRSIVEFHAYDPNNGKIIAIFRYARPETVEVFPHVLAVLYGDGGTLSHACTVAREMNLPCITALGQEFVAAMARHNHVRVKVQPQNGIVQIIGNS